MLVAIERTSMPSLRYRDESDAPSGGELVAEVLPENTAMLKLFKKFGFRTDSKKSPQVVHLTLQLP